MKIGVLSFYYNNYNYGGMLQAYALCEYIKSLGYEVEQISFDCLSPKINTFACSRREKWNDASGSEKILLVLGHIGDKIKQHFPKKESAVPAKYNALLLQRQEAFLRFQNVIPHSERIYDEKTIAQCVNDYDVFIVGSDQIWNEHFGRPLFMLDFLPDNKKGIAYAASVAGEKLNSKQKRVLQENGHKFLMLSVREPNAVSLVEECGVGSVEWVLDPTMLLGRDKWDTVCSENQMSEEYIFCYFLGENTKARKVVEDFSREKKLPIVTLPFMHGQYHPIDEQFGDKKLFDVSPDQFISLIKHASYVFTDSYHASVFSSIYNKNYFVFDRNKWAMSSRIYGLMKIFGEEYRFCSTKDRMNIKYIHSMAARKQLNDLSHFNDRKRISEKFIKEGLASASRKENETEST